MYEQIGGVDFGTGVHGSAGEKKITVSGGCFYHDFIWAYTVQLAIRSVGMNFLGELETRSG